MFVVGRRSSTASIKIRVTWPTSVTKAKVQPATTQCKCKWCAQLTTNNRNGGLHTAQLRCSTRRNALTTMNPSTRRETIPHPLPTHTSTSTSTVKRCTGRRIGLQRSLLKRHRSPPGPPSRFLILSGSLLKRDRSPPGFLILSESPLQFLTCLSPR